MLFSMPSNAERVYEMFQKFQVQIFPAGGTWECLDEIIFSPLSQLNTIFASTINKVLYGQSFYINPIC